MSENTLPSCIGYYGKPKRPSGPCQRCPIEEQCKKVVAKERLQPVIEKFLEIEAVLRGEKSG